MKHPCCDGKRANRTRRNQKPHLAISAAMSAYLPTAEAFNIVYARREEQRNGNGCLFRLQIVPQWSGNAPRFLMPKTDNSGSPHSTRAVSRGNAPGIFCEAPRRGKGAGQLETR